MLEDGLHQPSKFFYTEGFLKVLTENKYNRSLNIIERESCQGKRTLEWNQMDIN